MNNLFDWKPPTKLHQAFDDFDAKNPQVYRLFKLYAHQARDAGHRHFGAAAIFERIRWHVAVETRGDDFKLNNNYRAFYARKMMREDHAFDDFFRTRKQRHETL